MTLPRRGLLLFAVAVAFAALPSCKKGGDSGKTKVAFVTNNPADFWTIAEKGAQDAAAKHDVELIFRKPEKGEAGIQRDIVNDLVNKKVSGIAVSVINPDEQTPDLKIVAGKLNLITVDNDAKDSGRLAYLGTDNYEAGKAVGRLVKEVMPEGGMVAIFVGQDTPINARERYAGVVDELAGRKVSKGETDLGKYKVYKGAPITDNVNETTAQDNAKDAIEKLANEPKICMVGLWAYNAPAILEAAKSKNALSKVKIVSFDEYPATLTAIQNGEIYATVVQDPYNFGYKSVELLADLAEGDKSKLPANGLLNIDYRVVVKDAAKDPVTGKDRLAAKAFEADLNKLLGK